MKFEKMFPLLSGELKTVLKEILNKHSDCNIVKDLLTAHELINIYNENLVVCGNGKLGEITLKILSERISNLLTDHARMIGFRINEFLFSYLPEGKEPVYSGERWSRENRETAKPGRLIQKVLVNKYTCLDFEHFSNWLKAEIMNSGEFHIVSGSDITKYYLEDNYYRCNGTLGNSCMRHYECQDFFKLYEEHAKMLVCLKDNLVVGRAIVWELDKGTFMDRIYTCYDYLESLYIEYAEDHKWYHRENNSLLHDDEIQYWLGPDDDYQNAYSLDLTIKLDKKYNKWPYVDSFRYFNPDNLTINTDPEDGSIYLSETNGGTNEDQYDTYTCECCGRIIEVPSHECLDNYGLIYSDWEDCWYCEDCAFWCDGIDDYISKNTEHAYAHETKNTIMTFPLDYLKNSLDYVCINGEYYKTTLVIEETDENGSITYKLI